MSMSLNGDRITCDAKGCRKSVKYGSMNHEMNWQVRGGSTTTFDFCSIACEVKTLTAAVCEAEHLEVW